MSRTAALTRLWARRLALLSPFVAVACGPASTTKPIVAPPTPPPVAKAPPAESPARWELHPTKASNLRAKLDLGTLGTLYVGDGGERWLDKPGTGAKSANTLLPESIAGVIAGPGGKGVLLAGASGALYGATDPLGPISDKKVPTTPLRSISAGKSAIVGIAADGSAMRTTDGGGSWTKIDLGSAAGTLVQIALTDAGNGLALFAPQRVMVTQDDGATWKPLPSPGVGAKKLVLDVNGDLMLEGLDASAVLKLSPLRLERVARAPRSGGFDLALSTDLTPLGYAKAVAKGNGAFVGTRYVEAVNEPDDPTRWKLAIGPLGGKMEVRKLSELNGCEHVYVGGDAKSIVLACDEQQSSKKVVIGTGPSKPWSGSKWGGAPAAEEKSQIKIFRSEDDGKTFKDDGVTGSERGDSGHVWITPDHALVIDGACKRSKYGCYDGNSPPLVRLSGAKAFAKIGVPRGVTRFNAIAFSPNGLRAYALSRGNSPPLSFLVSSNGGKDFSRATLPSVQPADPKHTAISASKAEPGSISVDESGAIYATAHVANDWVLYTSTDDGATVKGTLLPFKADAVSMVGKRGFAYERHGRGWETIDGGVTWTEVGAPQSDANVNERLLACGTYGCLVGDRATRVGWGATAVTTNKTSDPGTAKVFAATPLKCTVDGEWHPLPSVITPPAAFDSDVANGVRWMAIRHDRAKGNVAVLVAKSGKAGLETKEISLLGPAARDTATASLPQVEGVAALRYSFKRDAPPKGAAAGALGPVTPNQKVDVDVSWWVAATNKVNHATIRGVGPLETRDFSTSKDQPGLAQIGLLSIAQGGIHVRPLATKNDAPLFFVHDNGKVDRLTWPELPTKDAAGTPLALRIDAIRAAGRSVLLGVGGPGLELYTAWANESGTSWESRTWGVWPEIRGTSAEVAWDFTYLGGRPSIVAEWPGGGGIAAAGWGAPLKGMEPDPSEAIALPTQKAVADPPRTCDAAALATPRVVAPYVLGSRHPVTVIGEGNDLLLATGSAVLHGSATDGCISAWEARGTTASITAAGAYTAIVAPDDLAHATLFKTTPGKGEVAMRSMTCVYAKDAMPAGLAAVEGFSEPHE